jgi:hypothetical protein
MHQRKKFGIQCLMIKLIGCEQYHLMKVHTIREIGAKVQK